MKKKYKIIISISEFGNLAKFYKRYAKGNRIITVEQTEFLGTSEQHNSGVMEDILTVTDKTNLDAEVRKFVKKNSLQGECFSIFREDDYRKKPRVLYTETDFDGDVRKVWVVD